ncbi:MAG TPA: SusC/RagA family TonB-linked outer membrane protein [Gemmatimonadales bacterium]|nr:SusC/RagA family TonB-linked outer membrane protein [Gemmatimonadales bacterium]
MKRIFVIALALAAGIGVADASAQQRQITGQVTSASGEAVAGANLSITGTAFAAVTNADGRYTIAAPPGPVTLVVRRIAFKRKEVSVPADQNAADVTLEPDVFNLEAVVVTGQATGVERRNAAIATTSVSGEEVSRVPAASLDRALAGRVPGAIISQNSGAPGGGTQIQLRGNNTVIGNPDPLFVVDGVIYSDASLPTGLFTVTGSSSNRGNGEMQDDPVNRLADLNPDDIESLEVLRGAAAASIYGSKAANGVIIIKTNHGRAGKPRATITQRMGFADLLRGPGTRAFTEAQALSQYATTASDTALIKSYEINGQLPTYDHLQEIAGNKPLAYETDLDVSGGSENTRYFLSASNKHDGGIIDNTFNNRQTLRANVDQSFSNKFQLSVNTAFTRNQTDKGFTNNDNTGASVTYSIAYIPGFLNIEPQNGVFSQPSVTYKSSNPLQTIALGTNDEVVTRFTGGATLTYQAIQTERHNLRLVGAGGLDFFSQGNEVFAPPTMFFEAVNATPGTSALSNANSRQWNWNANLIDAFAPTSGAFKATTSLGVQVEDRSINRSRVVAHGLLPDQSNIDQASVLGEPFELLAEERTLAFYLNEEFLTLGERLLLAAGLRAERSSANGATNRYYAYPKASASYRFPNLLGEGTEVKLRGAYGETGNQPLFGQKFTLLSNSVIGGQIGTIVGTAGGTSGAPDIRPERIKEFEAGVDANLWNGRATVEITGYTRHTYDLLLQATPASYTGYQTQILNGGVLWNEGIEIGAGITPVQKKNLNWVFRTTFTSLKNRVQELPVPQVCQPNAAVCGFRPQNAGFGLAFGEFFIQQGKPITQILGTDTNATGATIVRYMGQTNPRFRMSFLNDVTYKRLSVSMLWDWQAGGVAQNQTLSLYDCNGLAPDQATPAGQARFNACAVGIAVPFVQSTTFLKLREASLAVDLPEQWATLFGARTARLSVTGRNLLLFTGYFGYDPEVSNYGQQAIVRNIDLGPYPPQRSFLFSITAGF